MCECFEEVGVLFVYDGGDEFVSFVEVEVEECYKKFCDEFNVGEMLML